MPMDKRILKMLEVVGREQLRAAERRLRADYGDRHPCSAASTGEERLETEISALELGLRVLGEELETD